MGYTSSFKNFDIINGLTGVSGKILNPKEFLDNIIKPKYDKVLSEIEKDKIKAEAAAKLALKLKEDAESKIAIWLKEISRKKAEKKEKAIKLQRELEATLENQNNERMSDLFECLKECWSKEVKIGKIKTKDYDCINYELNKILNDSHFKKYINTTEFKSKYKNLLNNEILDNDYVFNSDKYSQNDKLLNEYLIYISTPVKKGKKKGGDIDYYEKYIKYKIKYLQLKNNITK